MSPREAAQIDGATALQTLFKIKLPMLVPSIMICVFITLTNAFKLFDQNLALTAGEPAHATEMLALNIYNDFYARPGLMWRGIGQAKAVIFCVIVIMIACIMLTVLPAAVFYIALQKYIVKGIAAGAVKG